MQLPFTRRLLRMGLLGLALGTVACATQPPESLEQARRTVQQARQDPAVVRYAPVALHEAEQRLQQAERVWAEDEDAAEAAHQAYLVRRQVQIAQARAGREQARAEIEQLAEARDRVLLQARSREAEAAEERAEVARLEAQRSARQLEQLREALKNARAEQTERGIVLSLGDMLFGFDEAQLKPGAEQNLDRLAAFLRDNPERQVIIEGHTDATGPESYNRQLSQQRASAVRDYLLRQGVSPQRVIAKGYGEAYPIAPNTNPSGRQANRRVELVILEPGEPAEAHLR